jgi:CBS domain containing-hemolysin-like protein
LITILLVIAILLAVNGLYVGAEFALVGTRRHRILRLAEEGSLRARILAPIVTSTVRLNRYISTCQLGITSSSLILGAYAQRTLAGTLGPAFVAAGLGRIAAETASFILVLAGITMLQVVVTEQVPKCIVLRHPLHWSLRFALPVRWSEMLFAGFLVVLQGSANGLLRLMGLSWRAGPSLHTPAEIGFLVAESARVGVVRRELEDVVRNALRFTGRTARDLMVPRVRVRGVPEGASLPEVRRILRESGHTRLPVYRGSPDVIVGMVHAKDLLLRTAGVDPPPPLSHLLRPVLGVPWSARSGDLLEQMREARASMAVVLDEHGGTAGIVTLEDLVEQVVGDVEDEFDPGARPRERLADGRLRLRGEMPLVDVQARFDLELPTEEAHTLGGLIMEALGRVARPGDRVAAGGVRLDVERMTGHRIETVLVTPARPDAEEEGPGT